MPELELMRPAQLRKPKWDPKKWHAVYEEVVMMDQMGYKNIEIAKLKGFTVVHVSNILNCEKAQSLKQLILDRTRETGVATFEERIEVLAEKALRRAEEVLNNDEYAEKNPGGIFDRSLKLLQATKKVAKTDDTTVTNLMVPAGVIDQLRVAMAESDAVRARHQLPVGEGVNTLR